MKYKVIAITKSGYVVEDADGYKGFVRRETWNTTVSEYMKAPGFGDFDFSLELPFAKEKTVKVTILDI